MGWADLGAETVQEAETAMAAVESAAQAIRTAISNVQPWLTPGTWQSGEATAWIGDWQGFYKTVQSCLDSLPAAEAQVVAQVRSDMQKMAQQHRGQPAPA